MYICSQKDTYFNIHSYTVQPMVAMQLGYTYIKNRFIVYLKFEFNWESFSFIYQTWLLTQRVRSLTAISNPFQRQWFLRCQVQGAPWGSKESCGASHRHNTTHTYSLHTILEAASPCPAVLSMGPQYSSSSPGNSSPPPTPIFPPHPSPQPLLPQEV